MPTVQIPQRRKTRGLQHVKVQNPGKGLNTLVSDQLINDAEASDLNNIQFVESGCPSKAFGMSSVGTGLSNNPKGLGVFYPSTIASRYVLTIDGTSLKYLNGATWTAISGAAFTANKEVNFVQCNDILYVWDADQSGCSVDSSLTLTRLTTAPNAAFGIWYSGVQCVAGVPNRPNRLYISDSTTTAGDFTNAAGTLSTSAEVPTATVFAGTGAKFYDINPGDGDKITGLAKFQSVLLVFKERSIYQLTFDTSGNAVVSQVSAAQGSVSHKSIDNVENDVFYLSRKGYYVIGNEPNYYSSIRSNELSARVNPIIQTINSGSYTKVSSIFSDFKFYSSVPTGSSTTNNSTIVYDRRYLAWSKLDYILANSWAEYIDTSGTKHLYYASDTEAKVYEVSTNGYSANNSAINAYWVSKAFNAGAFDQYKRWVWIDLLFRQILGTVTVTIYSDNNSVIKTTSISSTTDSTGSIGTVKLGSQILGGTGNASSGTSTNNVPYRIKVGTKSRTIKIKISNANNNESFTLLEFDIAYVPYSLYSFPSAQKIF